MHILVTGASGLLGGYLLRHLSGMDHRVTAWSGSTSGTAFGFQITPMSLTDGDALRRSLLTTRPDVVVHAAAMASVAKCFKAPELAWRVNAEATRELVTLVSELSARLLLVSTDLVFDGSHGNYRELDEAQPLSIYGRTKLAAEEAALGYDRAAVVRVSLLFGPAHGQRRSFFDEQVAAIREARPCQLFSDEWRTPVALSTAASALIRIAESDFTGRLHLGGPERMSRLEMGQRLAGALGCDAASLISVTRDSAAADEPRPRDNSLDSSRWRSLFLHHPWPTYEEALKEMLD